MNGFAVNTVPLAGFNLIEASAGTGKTYALAELYLRLITEQALTVDQILVVTYTRAATEELRDRLRQKLVAARATTLSQHAEESALLNRLNLAIQSFDEAAIFTIHGFCQRVLTDQAFATGVPFEQQVVTDDQTLLQLATDDFWRREMATADPDLVSYLLSNKESPERLLNSIKDLVGKPYLHCLPITEMDPTQLAQQLQTQFSQVKHYWWQEQDEIIATLTDKSLLNGNQYRTASVTKWLAQLTELVAQPRLPPILFANFDRFTLARLQTAVKKNKVLPELAFWQQCQLLLEHYQQLQQARQRQHQALRWRLLHYLRQTVPLQKQQQQIACYDDLLLDLQRALNSVQGEHLVAQLRCQYQAALIDEFQDTDPIQYASFSRIFAGSDSVVFLVGDPKQAIYSFRGADIFTYLTARTETDNQYSLTSNWRSHPQLVSALNQLFSRLPHPFIYQDLLFQPVLAQREPQAVLTVNDKHYAGLQILYQESDKALAKEQFREQAANATAAEIAQLLTQAHTAKASLLAEATGQAKPLSGADIAVLVRSHRQATMIQSCLQQRGIASVQQGRENVFLSAEAQLLQRVLLAIAQPNQQAKIIAALSSDFWGITALTLYQIQQDEALLSNYIHYFYRWQQIGLQQGFIQLFNSVLTTPLCTHLSAQQHLLCLADGERKLTNLSHLAELIHQHGQQQGDSIEGALQYLTQRQQRADSHDEVAQLRLESDEQLVTIITIHKSKGLEYPIVFCPFLWDSHADLATDKPIVFHDEDNSASIAFAEPELSDALQLAARENAAEQRRLLYVALTRARERCVIIWGQTKNIEKSALFSLLHPQLLKADNKTMASDLTELANNSEGAITISPLSVEPALRYQASDDNQQRLAARQFTGVIQQPWRIGSFTSLSHTHDQQFELPDYDQHQLALPRESGSLDRFGFPRGAEAGTCLHAILEVIDFSDHTPATLNKAIKPLLIQYGFAEKWQHVVAQWLLEVVNTPLREDKLTLADIAPSKRINELAFYFPVAQLSVQKIQYALLPLLADNQPLARVLKRLQFYDLTGFVKGFIDLVFEYQGQYYLVDYKSNYLGDSEDDYQSAALTEAMISHDYPLQYLLYSLALHRYLQARLVDYQPAKHLGGIYYLFIRGMKPQWQQAGIVYHKLDLALLEALDQCITNSDYE